MKVEIVPPPKVDTIVRCEMPLHIAQMIRTLLGSTIMDASSRSPEDDDIYNAYKALGPVGDAYNIVWAPGQANVTRIKRRA